MATDTFEPTATAPIPADATVAVRIKSDHLRNSTYLYSILAMNSLDIVPLGHTSCGTPYPMVDCWTRIGREGGRLH